MSAEGGSGDAALSVGQLRRQVLLGSEAVYRVCELTDSSVTVEVVRSPGLAPGRRFVFTREAVQRMAVADVDEAEE